MARHQQKPRRIDMVCPKCKKDKCNECIDVTLILAGRDQICACIKQGHDGEPRDRQVQDPFTGAIIGPGAIIHTDGTVEINRKKLKGER